MNEKSLQIQNLQEEKRQLQEQLQTTQEQFLGVINIAEDAIINIDQQFNITLFNFGAEKIFGYTQSEIIGQSLNILIPKEYRSVHDKHIKEFSRIPKNSRLMSERNIIWGLRKDGNTFPAEASISKFTAHNKQSIFSVILRDITEHQQMEKMLQYRIELENLITSISANFINLVVEEIDRGIDYALQALGWFLHTDRSYVFLFSDDKKVIVNTHTWCSGDIVFGLQNAEVLVDSLPWLTAKIIGGEIAYIPSIDVLPVNVEREKQYFKENDVQSLIAFPMVCGGLVMGFLGFESVQKEKIWLEEDIVILKTVSEIFANVLERKRAEIALRESKMRLQLLNSISIRITSGMLSEQIIEHAIGKISKSFPNYQVSYSKIDFTGNCTNALCSTLASQLLIDFQKLLYALFSTDTNKITQGQYISVYDTLVSQEIKDIVGTTSDFQIRALLAVPVIVDEEIGILSFGFNKKHLWNEHEVTTLKEISEYLAIALKDAKARERRKKAEENLQMFRNLVDRCSDAIFIINPEDAQVVDVNRKACSNLLYSRDELLKMQILDIEIIEHNSWKNHIEDLQKVEYMILKGQHKRKDGSRFRVEINVKFIAYENKNYLLSVVRDLTERNKLERMKEEFISVVSHEIRTPLTSITGSLGLLLGGIAGHLSCDVQKLLDISYRNSQRLVRLINDTLDIEKIELGKMDFKFSVVAIMPIIERTIEENRSYGQQFDTTYIIKHSIGDGKIYADCDRITQVVTNLLSNAAKFSPKKGVVEVSVLRNNGYFRVLVKDHGAGVPKEFQARVFQKFAQADSSDARKKGGSGLGLSICKAIVENHKGHIGFTTEIDRGTTFYFDLPEYDIRETL